MTSTKLLQRIAAVATLAIILLLFSLLHSEKVEWLPLPEALSRGGDNELSRLHLLVVATASNLNLCRLVLSGTVLNYPPPILIDWEGEGIYNASESHLAKITGPLRYLEELSPSKDDDLVLMVDGYDVIFQFGPDVLLERYFSALSASEARLKGQLGAEFVQQHNVHNTIVFGPDKTCFPLDHQHPRCWAIPSSPLPGDAFGPETDHDMEHHRPRWVNSGTIIGPVADMRELFRATWSKVEKTFDPENGSRNSDQMYFADVFADQEYVRTLVRYGEAGLPPKEEKTRPDLGDGHPTEFHIGLDYDSRMFQTCAGYEGFLSWTHFDQPAPFTDLETPTSQEIILQKDVLASQKPFAAIIDDKTLRDRPWTDVSLGVNVVTGFAFPLLHFTSDKSLRDKWWPQMWFFPQLKRLMLAASKKRNDKIGSQKINGVRWQKDMPYESKKTGGEANTGAWSDKGERLSWDLLCKEHEETLFNG